MKQRRARPVFASSRRLSRKRLGSIFRFRPFSHASSRRLSRKRLGSIEKAVLSPPTGPLAGTQEAVLSPPTGPLATGPLAGAQEAVLSPPTGPLAGRHLFRVISSATAFHNLIRIQKSPEGALAGTPPECLTLLSEPAKEVCEAASSTPCLRFKPPAVTETPRKHLPLSTLQQRFKPPAVTETPRKHRKSRSLTSHGSSGWYTRSRSLTSHGSSGHGSSGWRTRSRSLTSHGSSGW